ncbi:MAG: BTAD domain-containing putative transcriptional regulator [Ilumatobacteraceae bacterium]
MQIRLLGELQVLDDDQTDVVVTGAKLRALLVMLTLSCGRVVPADQLVDALWGPESTAAARNGLQGLVSKLRRALGSASLVATRGGGYALEVPPESVDLHRFEQLVAEGRARTSSDLASAIALLAQADSLWRGGALAEFAYEEFASAEVSRITELRLTAVEERLDIELQLGRHRSVIGELEALVTAHALRERLRGLLMIALYRAGRQADALRTFQDGRRILGEELGLEPGPELRQLEAAILAQDPSLDVKPPGESDSGVSTGQRSSVPGSLTALVGRDDEVRDLTRLFRDHRFITLVGPGGVGKTRLALEVARDEASRLAHGACMVELAHVGDPEGVAAAIGSALDLPDAKRLAEMIGNRDLLILLDNCEHVIGTAAEIAEDLLRRCPGLRLLATSREGLRVAGETIWPVPPLATDDARRLFIERARAAGASLALTDEVNAVISDICIRLDGLPLAIELAAARTRAFPIQQISSRLNDRFRLLTGGSRTALPRQQTLRAVVDWSYELLFNDEQRVFERLSVFLGGCDLATAEAICADDSLDAADLGDIIQTLVDKSLVIAVPRGDELRFTQLQTLAQYGREKLAERGDAEKIRNAMSAHYGRLCARSANAYIGDEQRSWLVTIDREQDNLRGALEWAVANDDADTALTIAGGCSWPHWLAGSAVEGKRWIDDAFRCKGEASERATALALIGRGLLDFQLGAPAGVDSDLKAALATFLASGDLASTCLAYSFYAEVASARGEVEEGRRRRLELLDFYSGMPDDPFVLAARAFTRGKLSGLAGDLEASERHYRESVTSFSRIDRPMMLAMTQALVADFDERLGNYRDAIDNLEQSVATNETLGLRGFNGSLLARLGWALLQDGDARGSELAYDRALDLGRRLSNTPVVFHALIGRAVLHRLDGRNATAAEAATEALDVYLAGGPRRLANRVDPRADLLGGAAVCCTELGILAAGGVEAEHAARLLGHAERLRANVGLAVPRFQRDAFDQACETASLVLGPDAFRAAFELGRLQVLGDTLMFRL